MFAQLPKEEKKRRRWSLQGEEEVQSENIRPVLHLQGQKKKSYTLV